MTQVNQNLTDIINGTSDGTKDFSINALTVAGNFTANGTTNTIGNASSDDLVITASLASSIPIKTHNSYDIGSVTTLGLRAIYFASSSATKTAKLQGPASSSDVIITLPAWTSTLRPVATTTAQTTTYAILSNDEFVSTTTGSGWTATLPTAVGVAGKTYTVNKTSSDVNALTVATTSAQTIDGAATTTLNTQYESIIVISDGANWHIIDRKIPSTWTAFTPTGGWSSNVTYTGFWRRVGTNMELQYAISATGATTGTLGTVNMPTGYTIATGSTVLSGGYPYTSIGNIRDAGSGNNLCVAFINDTNSFTVQAIDTNAQLAAITATVPQTWANGDTLAFYISVPVTGWK